MSDDLRAKFLNRISTVGWGARESVQTVLGLLVSDLRAQISESAFAEDDLQRAIRFHDTAEVLWRDALASDPPLEVAELRSRLDKLVGECSGPLMGSMPHLQRAREHAHSLDVMHRVRDE
jgi:hypothetical protein